MCWVWARTGWAVAVVAVVLALLVGGSVMAHGGAGGGWLPTGSARSSGSRLAPDCSIGVKRTSRAATWSASERACVGDG